MCKTPSGSLGTNNGVSEGVAIFGNPVRSMHFADLGSCALWFTSGSSSC